MRRILAAPAAVLAVLTVTVAAPAGAATGSCPDVVSHATTKLLAPENTLPGIAAAATAGAEAVEMDVQWSSSGFPVLMHDATVDRTTNGTGSPASLGLSQLRALSAADYAPWATSAFGGFTGAVPKTPVPYGWEFMNAVKTADLDVILDIHAAPTEVGMAKLGAYITGAGWTARTLIMGPPAWVTSMRGWQPDLRYAVIEYNAATTIRRGSYLASLGVEAYIVPGRDVDPADVTYWHSYGLDVYAWSSDSTTEDVAATWARLRSAGVDTLITNQPAAARAVWCTPQPTTAAPTTMPIPTTPPATPAPPPSEE